MAKMTKQVKTMVEYVNDYCKANHVKNTDNDVFHITGALLLAADCFQGFRYATVDGRYVTSEVEFDHLEYLIK